MKNISCFILLLLFSAMLQANCNAARPYYEQAIADKKAGNYEQALSKLQKSAQLCPRYGVYLEQGKVLVKLDRLDDALASFKQAGNYAREGTEEKTNLLANIALVHYKKGALQQASFHIEQSYAIARENSPKKIISLRKAIDMKNASHIVSADEIKQTLIASRSFGVAPRVKFNSITFKFDSTELTAQGQQQIVELGKVLTESLNRNKQALLIGHTDKTGSAAYNLTLSRQRAEAVKQTLIRMHPNLNGLLQTQGKGEQELRYYGDTENDHQLNRRVEMQLL